MGKKWFYSTNPQPQKIAPFLYNISKKSTPFSHKYELGLICLCLAVLFTPFLPFRCKQEGASGEVVVFGGQTCGESDNGWKEKVWKVLKSLRKAGFFLWIEEMVELEFVLGITCKKNCCKCGGGRKRGACIIGCWRGGVSFVSFLMIAPSRGKQLFFYSIPPPNCGMHVRILIKYFVLYYLDGKESIV